MPLHHEGGTPANIGLPTACIMLAVGVRMEPHVHATEFGDSGGQQVGARTAHEEAQGGFQALLDTKLGEPSAPVPTLGP